MRRASLALLLGAGILLAAAQAQLIQNGCFQEPFADVGANGYSQHDANSPTASIGPWTVTTGTVDQINADSFWASVPECGCGISLELNGVSPGAVTQMASPLVAGTSYTLTWMDTVHPGTDTCSYSVEATGGGTSQTYPVDRTGNSNENPQWQPQNYTFTATGTTSNITFTSITPSSGSDGCSITNVRLQPTSAAPNTTVDCTGCPLPCTTESPTPTPTVAPTSSPTPAACMPNKAATASTSPAGKVAPYKTFGYTAILTNSKAAQQLPSGGIVRERELQSAQTQSKTFAMPLLNASFSMILPPGTSLQTSSSAPKLPTTPVVDEATNKVTWQLGHVKGNGKVKVSLKLMAKACSTPLPLKLIGKFTYFTTAGKTTVDACLKKDLYVWTTNCPAIPKPSGAKTQNPGNGKTVVESCTCSVCQCTGKTCTCPSDCCTPL